MGRRYRVLDFGMGVPPPVNSDDADPIDPVSQMVRQCYVLCYRHATGSETYGDEPIPAYDGGTDQFGRNIRRKVWPRLAQTILELHADPLTYIKFHFEQSRRRHPTPQMLACDAAKKSWYLQQEYTDERVSYALRGETNQLNVMVQSAVKILGWDYDTAMRYYINGRTGVDLSPLFRYCMGVLCGFPETMARFREPALLQYLFQSRAYDERWGYLVPDDLKADAKGMREKLGCIA